MNKYSDYNLHQLKYLLKNTTDTKDILEIQNTINKIIKNSHKKWNITDLIIDNNPEEDIDYKYNKTCNNYLENEYIRTSKKESNDKIFTRMMVSSITDNYSYEELKKPLKNDEKAKLLSVKNSLSGFNDII